MFKKYWIKNFEPYEYSTGNNQQKLSSVKIIQLNPIQTTGKMKENYTFYIDLRFTDLLYQCFKLTSFEFRDKSAISKLNNPRIYGRH